MAQQSTPRRDQVECLWVAAVGRSLEIGERMVGFSLYLKGLDVVQGHVNFETITIWLEAVHPSLLVAVPVLTVTKIYCISLYQFNGNSLLIK